MSKNQFIVSVFTPKQGEKADVTFAGGLDGSHARNFFRSRLSDSNEDLTLVPVVLSDLDIEWAASQFQPERSGGSLSFDAFEDLVTALEEPDGETPPVPQARLGLLAALLLDSGFDAGRLLEEELPDKAYAKPTAVDFLVRLLGVEFPEPESQWKEVPWEYLPDSPLPRRDTRGKKLPLHAPEFDRHWSHSFRAALIVAAGCRANNSIPLLREWFGTIPKYVKIPAWARSPRLYTLLGRYPQQGPVDLKDLNFWFPTPEELPTLRDDLDAWTDFTERRLFNGFAPQPLQQRQSDGWWVLDIDWSDVPRDGNHLLPDVRIEWAPGDGGQRPRMHSIETRLPGEDAVRHVRDDVSDEAWWMALYIARSVVLVSGQLDIHLARCHLLLETVALLVEVPGAHPTGRVSDALAPFIRDVTGVNRVGDALVFQGPGVLPRMTGLDDEGIALRIAHSLGALDWKGFAPRGACPILADDRFAKVAALFWEGIGNFVDDALKDVNDFDVDRLAAAISQHNDRKVPEPRHRAPLAEHDWVWPAEWGLQRDVHLSVPTTPDEVRAFCRYVIWHASFFHSWVNDEGWTDGGSLLHACFGLQSLAPPEDLVPENIWFWLEKRLPPWQDCVPQIAVGWALNRITWGMVGDPSDKLSGETEDKRYFGELDMVRTFVAAFEQGEPTVRARLDALEFDLARTRIRVNT